MRAKDFVDSYFDAWNRGDAVAVAEHLAEDGVYWDVPENSRSNYDELIVGLDEFFSQYSHRYELLGEILSSPTTIAFQYRMYPRGKKGC